MKVVVTYRSRTGNTQRAAEHIGAAFRAAGHLTTVSPYNQLDYSVLAKADLVCVGTWVDGLIAFGHRPGDTGKLLELPMLWNKPTVAFMTYAIHPGKCIDLFANWLEANLAADVFWGEAIRTRDIEALAPGFVDDVLSRINIGAPN